MRVPELTHNKIVFLTPKAPYNFDANMHKPSHFPSSDTFWEPGVCWITMNWKHTAIGLKLENKGTVDTPRIKIAIYSKKKLPDDFVKSMVTELRWRFNTDSDISSFCSSLQEDVDIGSVIKKWRGMKPIATNSLYESLVIYVVLQNATVRRSVQMLENLFQRFGKNVRYDGKTLSLFWDPEAIGKSSEEDLRALKVGYRAKFLMKLSEQFASSAIDEQALRMMKKEDVRKEMLSLYGIGPASVEYLLFEDFYFYDALQMVPPWETKILSRLLFNKESSSTRILRFFKRFKRWEKLAFHYVWEDVFWRRKNKHIPWLEKEIRL